MKHLIGTSILFIAAVYVAKVAYTNRATLQELKDELESAIRIEWHERAAVLRDRIKAREREHLFI